MIKKKIKKIGFFKFKSDFFLFKLDLLFKLIIFSSKKIIKFYYKILQNINNKHVFFY